MQHGCPIEEGGRRCERALLSCLPFVDETITERKTTNHRQASGGPKGSLSLRLPGLLGDGSPINPGTRAEGLVAANPFNILG